jgi:hypothetical protein
VRDYHAPQNTTACGNLHHPLQRGCRFKAGRMQRPRRRGRYVAGSSGSLSLLLLRVALCGLLGAAVWCSGMQDSADGCGERDAHRRSEAAQLLNKRHHPAVPLCRKPRSNFSGFSSPVTVETHANLVRLPSRNVRPQPLKFVDERRQPVFPLHAPHLAPDLPTKVAPAELRLKPRVRGKLTCDPGGELKRQSCDGGSTQCHARRVGGDGDL